MFQFLSESPIKLEWFLDNAVLRWCRDEALCGLARDIEDHALREALNYFYPGQAVTFCLAANHQTDRLLDFGRKERAIESLYSGDSARHLREMAEEALIIELVSNLHAQAVDLGASDVHVEPGEGQFAVRMRVDGVLHARLTQPVERFPAVASRIKLISGVDIAERRLPQDGRITARVSGREMDIRVSTVPCALGESIVLRMLTKERDELTLKNLGMEADHLAMFRSWVHTSNGVVLVTGPTGWDKSTTLSAALEEIDDGIKKIITVEDPDAEPPKPTKERVMNAHRRKACNTVASRGRRPRRTPAPARPQFRIGLSQHLVSVDRSSRTHGPCPRQPPFSPLHSKPTTALATNVTCRQQTKFRPGTLGCRKPRRHVYFGNFQLSRWLAVEEHAIQGAFASAAITSMNEIRLEERT